MQDLGMQNEQLAYTINDAAAAMGIRRTKLYELIGSGQLRTKKIGRRTVVLASSMREFVAS